MVWKVVVAQHVCELDTGNIWIVKIIGPRRRKEEYNRVENCSTMEQLETNFEVAA